MCAKALLQKILTKSCDFIHQKCLNYKDRMKIEASNRATKSAKFGLGLEHSMTKSIERIKILLLLEQIVSLVAWLVGAYKEDTKTNREYANGSMKGERRLSLVKLGLRALKRIICITYGVLMEMIHKFALLEANLC